MGNDDDIAGERLDAAINHHQISILDPVLVLAIDAGSHVRGADGVGNQDGMQIHALTLASITSNPGVLLLKRPWGVPWRCDLPR